MNGDWSWLETGDGRGRGRKMEKYVSAAEGRKAESQKVGEMNSKWGQVRPLPLRKSFLIYLQPFMPYQTERLLSGEE